MWVAFWFLSTLLTKHKLLEPMRSNLLGFAFVICFMCLLNPRLPPNWERFPQRAAFYVMWCCFIFRCPNLSSHCLFLFFWFFLSLSDEHLQFTSFLSLFDYNYCVSIKEGLDGRRSEGVIIETPTLGSSQTRCLKEQARGQAACACSDSTSATIWLWYPGCILHGKRIHKTP